MNDLVKLNNSRPIEKVIPPSLASKLVANHDDETYARYAAGVYPSKKYPQFYFGPDYWDELFRVHDLTDVRTFKHALFPAEDTRDCFAVQRDGFFEELFSWLSQYELTANEERYLNWINCIFNFALLLPPRDEWKRILLFSQTLVAEIELFHNMPDGIHEVTISEDIAFHKVNRIYCDPRVNKWAAYYVVKNAGCWMFFGKRPNTGKLCMLRGAKPLKIEHQDLNYYFERLPEYVAAVSAAYAPYYAVISQLAGEVSALGGSGTIHGCIVDIDFNTHIYLNPFDGTVTAYYANDVSERLVYRDIASAFHNDNVSKELLANGKFPLLNHAVESKRDALVKVPAIVIDDSKNKIELDAMTGTDIYKPSYVLNGLQSILEHGVVRVWNESILNNRRSIEEQAWSSLAPCLSELRTDI